MNRAHAPGAERALAHDDDMPEEEPVAAKAWQVPALQWIRVRSRAATTRARRALLATTTFALDRGIACLQGLRRRAGTEVEQDASGEHAGPEQDATLGRLADEPAAEAAAAPEPRRLRRLLPYLGVILVAAALGSGLAYKLLTHVLSRQASEIQRQELKLSGYSMSVAELRKKLALQRAQRADAQARLAKSLAQNARTIERLRALRAGAEAAPAKGLAARKARGAWTGSGNCTLGSGDVRATLAGCIAQMNRR